jgi:aldose 1-epimerase
VLTEETTALDGFPIRRITLDNGSIKAVLTDLGARLLELHVPGRDGDRADVVLARKTIGDVFSDDHYMGATAGRYAGRIRAGRFRLDGTEAQVATNEGANHLHGGFRGFDKHVWSTRVHPEGEAVTFSRVSADGEEGFPGELVARVTYSLDGATLKIVMTATTDAPTIVRMVNHAYFNLMGHDAGTILDHQLQVFASHYVPLDDELLPDGTVVPVAGTVFDFLQPHAIGERNAQVPNAGAGRDVGESPGYDHIWALDGDGMRLAAVLSDPQSGRRLEVETDQAAVCIYVGGYMEGLSAKGDLAWYPAFAGLTFETTGYPDDINQPGFPSPVVRPGKTYTNRVVLSFSTS